jgi:NADH-quinone oxidoreductase subunit M
MLNIIFIILLSSILIIFFLEKTNIFFIRCFGLFVSSVVFLISCFFLLYFDFNTSSYQHVVEYNLSLNNINFLISFGIDGVSIFFIVLSTLLIFICFVFIWKEKLIKEFVLTLLLLELLLIAVFCSLDILFFYITFEAILIPMYLMIGLWGSRERKIRAIYLFFFYTLVSSFCLLLGLLYINSIVGSLSYDLLVNFKFSFEQQYWLWLAFFMSFASKIPMFPLHIWLPEAHVEAPSVGSVLLAGILLKLGVYGFIRYNLCLFPDASIFFCPLVYILSIFGILYGSMNALRQSDLKRIIAYSSVAHMNLITLGIFSFEITGIEGSILQSLSHGFVSGALFLLIGILYDRYHSRSIYYYGGLVHSMPMFSSLFLIFTMANIALPGTSSFVGEFLLLLGILKINFLLGFFACFGVILCGTYSLWLCNRILFGNLKINYTLFFYDISHREFLIILPLLLLVFILGVYPTFFLSFLHFNLTDTFFCFNI